MLSATKIILGTIPAMALFMGASAVSTTGDYHHGSSLKCYQCHTMHYSQQHEYNGRHSSASDPFGGYPGASGPYTYLLKGSVNEICLSCHDSGDDKDVLGLDGGAYTNGRLAGALNGETGSAFDVSGEGYNWWAGHTLGSTDAAPGATTWTNDNGLDCVDCHHQHGYNGNYTGANLLVYPTNDADWVANGTYRNLVGGTRQISYVTGATNDTEYDVYQIAGAHSSTHYDLNNVNYNQPDSNGGSAFADWCGSCHSNFHGAVGGVEIGGDTATNHEFIRHPSAFVNVGGQSSHGHTSLSVWNNTAGDARVKALSSDGNWTVGTATDITPSCMSCHKAHGNQNEFGLIFVSKGDAATDMGEEGSPNGSSYSTCSNCHVQGV
jgi:hypothetical protein